MHIDCYLSERCGSENALRKNIEDALTLESTEAQVSFSRINDEKARTLGLKGSPSIFINGIELQPIDAVGFS